MRAVKFFSCGEIQRMVLSYINTQIQCHATTMLKEQMKSNLIIQFSFIEEALAQAFIWGVYIKSNAVPMSYPLWSKLNFIAFQCQDSRAYNGFCVRSIFPLLHIVSTPLAILHFHEHKFGHKTGESAGKIGYACSIIYWNGFRWPIQFPYKMDGIDFRRREPDLSFQLNHVQTVILFHTHKTQYERSHEYSIGSEYKRQYHLF